VWGTEIVGGHINGVFALYCHIFGRLRKTAESDCQLRLTGLPVRSHGTTQLPLDGFSLHSIFEYFSKIYLQKSSFFFETDKNNGCCT